MGPKIAISLAGLVLILLCVGAYAYLSLADIAAAVDDARLAQERAVLAARVEVRYTSAVLLIRRYLGDGVDSYLVSALEDLQVVLREEERLLYLAPPADRSRVEAVIGKTKTYVAGVTGDFIPLVKQEKQERAAGNPAVADELAISLKAKLLAYTALARQIQSGLQGISVDNEDTANNKLLLVNQATAALVRAIFYFLLLALVAAILISYRLTKSVTAPLESMTRSMDEMAAGNFGGEISPLLPGRTDEFGLMAASLSTMKKNTGDLIGQLHEQQARTLALLTASPDLILHLSGDGRYLEIIEPAGWNPFYLQTINIGDNVADRLAKKHADIFQAAIERTLATGEAQTFEYQIDSGGGHWTRECRTAKIANDQVIFIIRDITHRRQVEETLRQIVEGMSGFTGQELFDYLTAYFAKTFNVRYCFIGEFPEEGTISLLSSMVRGKRLSPFCFQVKDDQPSHEVFHGSNVIYKEKIWQAYPFFTNIQGQVAGDADESTSRLMETYIGVSLKDASGQVLGIMALMDERPVADAELIIAMFRIFAARVASELERLVNERKMQHMAYHDSLTGLPNRWRFLQLLDDTVAQADENGDAAAVLRFDIDNYRYVNESIGRAGGDRLFIAAAARFRDTIAAICPECHLARLDGDNFVIIVKGPEAETLAGEMARALIQSLTQPFRCGDRDIYLSTSVGISLYPQHGDSGDDLLACAERALNYTKEQEKGGLCVYNPSLQTEAMKKLAMLNDLRNAITNQQFLVYYQPQFATSDRRLMGVEALVRWRHPQRGLIPPLEFIPLAETSGLIIPIGEWVMAEACGQLRRWLDAGAGPIRVAVNISAVQFSQPGFVDMVRRTIEKSGIEPDLLELEITENITMEGVEKVREKLSDLSDMGVVISIDDFGTGYSSLSYLQTFPLRSLKIDRSFVRGLTENQANADIVSAIIALAHSLSLQVVAEGVETEDEMRFLREKDCDLIQGYLLGYPQPAEELALTKTLVNEKRPEP